MTPAETKTKPKGPDAPQGQQDASQKAGWPRKGYDGPEPWELADEHYEPEDDGYPQPYTGPGAVTHNKPILGEGSAGADVAELARRLALLGPEYRDNTICQGRNPGDVLDSSVMRSVRAFQRDYGVRENEQSFNGGSVPGSALVGGYVGPYTWQAIIQVSDEAGWKN
jgi:peptidoglycan hydrolase-like protein with peptidoglycan-binding domain